jgi:hypothetical protein
MSATAVVAGALANKPWNGGAAWTRLSFVLGLRRLGCDVVFVEEIAPDTCVDTDGRPAALEDSTNAAFFWHVVHRFGLDGRAALIDEATGRSLGMDTDDVVAAAEDAVVLVNLSGHLRSRRILDAVQRRVFVDLDPGYTQAWHDAGIDVNLAAHHVFFTVGANIGTPACSIPTDGIRWQAMCQPLVLEEWPAVPAPDAPRFTTVGSWRGAYGPVTIGGATYGAKGREFRKLAPLPRHVDARFEAALDIHPADARDRELMESNGWSLTDPTRVARDPDTFRDYVQESWAECSVAQSVYAQTRSGWLGDRTIRYLATGRPALVQDTGLARILPVGDGLLPFATLEEAQAGAREIQRNYEAHAWAARELAERYFDSDTVLSDMLDRARVGG